MRIVSPVRAARSLRVILGLGFLLGLAIPILEAIVLQPVAPAAAADGTPMTLEFTATSAGQFPYVMFGSSAAASDSGETVCVKVEWGYISKSEDGEDFEAVTYFVGRGIYFGSGIVDFHTGDPVVFPSAATYTVTISPIRTDDAFLVPACAATSAAAGTWLTMYGAVRGESDTPDASFFSGAAALTAVTSFGDLGITSLSNAFASQAITDVPTSIPAGVVDLAGTFANTTGFNDPDVGSWNVSSVETTEGMFRDTSVFDQPIGDWDVSSVEDMNYMFHDAAAFDRPLGNWERDGSTVGNVADMRNMFEGASTFDQDLGSWDVSSVENMSDMFEDAEKFNNGGSDSINGWNVSSVDDMDNMFENAMAFNQPIGSWNVANVTMMADMFKDAVAFDQPIGDWDVSSVEDMNDMFERAATFNQPLAGWERTGSTLSSVTRMDGMFAGATKFDQPIGNWNVSSVTEMSSMFAGAIAFDQPLGDWNVANVALMDSLFEGAEAFNQPIGSWDVSSVTDMSSMFAGAIAFDQPLGYWNVANVEGMDSMFEGATAFDQPIGDWDVSGVTAMGSMFTGAASFDRSLGDWVLTRGVSLWLNDSGMSSSCYDATLVGWALDPSRPFARINAGGIDYSPVGGAARASLVDRSWEITGDTEVAVATGRCAEEAASSSSGGATLTLTCTPTDAPVGATVTCEVGGGDPDIDILWRTAVGDGQVASGAVRLGPDGTGTFRFVVPRSAAGRTLDVELVEWTGPIPIGVAGGPVPGSVPAGEGPGTGGVLPLAVSGLLLLVVAGAHRTGRRRALARP